MKKLFLYLLFAIVLFLGGFSAYVQYNWDVRYEAPYPELHSSVDSALIERGRYLVYGPAHCGTCHVPSDQVAAVEAGAELPLIGGWELNIPPGILRSPNLTPDDETGIGLYTDGELARALRHGVKRDGSVLFPLMPFQEISDEDVVAIISFLRSQPAVRHAVAPPEYTFLGKTLLAVGVLKPEGALHAPPARVSIDSSVAYGEYLANRVANCVGCHTERDLKTGVFTGPAFAGGMRFEPDEMSKGFGFITPNITPDPSTGIMASWDETTFIRRFRNGRVYPTSHMPWGAYSRMEESDLKAIYRYLKTLESVPNAIPKVMFAPGEEMPES